VALLELSILPIPPFVMGKVLLQRIMEGFDGHYELESLLSTSHGKFHALWCASSSRSSLGLLNVRSSIDTGSNYNR
jgi:hypothetical protein